MEWTTEKKVAYLLRLPWTLKSEKVTGEGETYWVVRAAEIPSALATGSMECVADEFWESLAESLRCYLDNGDEVPLPRGARLPWEQPRIAEFSDLHVSMTSKAPRAVFRAPTVSSGGLQPA